MGRKEAQAKSFLDLWEGDEDEQLRFMLKRRRKGVFIREGLRRSDDHFPDRFYSEPLPAGPFKAAKLCMNVWIDDD